MTYPQFVLAHIFDISYLLRLVVICGNENRKISVKRNKLMFAWMIVPVQATTYIVFFMYINGPYKKLRFVVNGTQYASAKYWL